MTDALDAVIDAALERALVDATAARQYFALAGVLERVERPVLDEHADRGGDRKHITDGRDGEDDDAAHGFDSGSENRRNRAVRADPLCASLVSTIAIQALARSDDPELDVDAWSPGSDEQWVEFVAIGASAAVRRFDADLESVAAQSGLPPAELTRYRRGARSGE